MAALVHPGDEVIVFEPVYDSYVPAIQLPGRGSPARPVERRRDYRPDWDGGAARWSRRDAHDHGQHAPQPHGQCVWSAADLQALAELTRTPGSSLWRMKVYEHIVLTVRATKVLPAIPSWRRAA